MTLSPSSHHAVSDAISGNRSADNTDNRENDDDPSHDRDAASPAPDRYGQGARRATRHARLRLGFDERLAMLVDREAVERDNAALAQRLRLAGLRQAACLEDLDYRTPRGLDRSLIQALAAGRWLQEHNNVLILGPTGPVT
jgi:DNA replication protein DnaC